MADIGAGAKQGMQAIRQTRALEPLTRVGFLSKGVVYILLGTLAVMAAMREGGQTTDQKGVIEFIAGQPFGTLALIFIAAGLLAYSLWRYIGAVSDVEGKGSDAKGLALRAGYFLSGIAHTGIAFFAIKILTGDSASRDSNSARTWTARLMELPGGTLLIGTIGLGLIGFGAFQARNGIKEKFKKDLKIGEMDQSEKEIASRAGTWGHCARGLVFGLIGAFLIYAAWLGDPGQARSLEGILDAVAAQPFGRVMLAVLATGLGMYGVYCLVEAKYRRIHH